MVFLLVCSPFSIVVILGPAAETLGLNVNPPNNPEFLNTARFMNYFSLFTLDNSCDVVFSRRIQMFLQIIQTQREEKQKLGKVLSWFVDSCSGDDWFIIQISRWWRKKNRVSSKNEKSVESMSKDSESCERSWSCHSGNNLSGQSWFSWVVERIAVCIYRNAFKTKSSWNGTWFFWKNLKWFQIVHHWSIRFWQIFFQCCEVYASWRKDHFYPFQKVKSCRFAIKRSRNWYPREYFKNVFPTIIPPHEKVW